MEVTPYLILNEEYSLGIDTQIGRLYNITNIKPFLFSENSFINTVTEEVLKSDSIENIEGKIERYRVMISEEDVKGKDLATILHKKITNDFRTQSKIYQFTMGKDQFFHLLVTKSNLSSFENVKITLENIIS